MIVLLFDYRFHQRVKLRRVHCERENNKQMIQQMRRRATISRVNEDQHKAEGPGESSPEQKTGLRPPIWLLMQKNELP
jgi:predicted RNA-binding protein with PUA-like domain